MKILVFYGKRDKDITYNITKKVLNKFERATIKEYFLPDDMAKPCLGCMNCYKDSEKNCYAYNKIAKIYENMTEADLIIFSTPTYCDNMPGHVKSFFDHFGFMWLNRRPNRIMFSKKALVISTSDKLKATNTAEEIKKNLSWWGISNVNVLTISRKNKNIDNMIDKTYKKVINSKNKISFKTKCKFYISRFRIKNDKSNEYDYNYWKEEGWLAKKRPW